jgi:hypothetical protein
MTKPTGEMGGWLGLGTVAALVVAFVLVLGLGAVWPSSSHKGTGTSKSGDVTLHVDIEWPLTDTVRTTTTTPALSPSTTGPSGGSQPTSTIAAGTVTPVPATRPPVSVAAVDATTLERTATETVLDGSPAALAIPPGDYLICIEVPAGLSVSGQKPVLDLGPAAPSSPWTCLYRAIPSGSNPTVTFKLQSPA